MTKFELIDALQDLHDKYLAKNNGYLQELDEQKQEVRVLNLKKDQANEAFSKYEKDLKIYEKAPKIKEGAYKRLMLKYQKKFLIHGILSLVILLCAASFELPVVVFILMSLIPVIKVIINFKNDYEKEVTEVKRVKKEYSSYKDIKRKRKNAKQDFLLLNNSCRLCNEKLKKLKDNHYNCELILNLISEILACLEQNEENLTVNMPNVDINTQEGIIVLRKVRYNLRKDDMNGKNI